MFHKERLDFYVGVWYNWEQGVGLKKMLEEGIVKYFVSWAWSHEKENRSGFGRSELEEEIGPVVDLIDVARMEKAVHEQQHFKEEVVVVAINWRQFEPLPSGPSDHPDEPEEGAHNLSPYGV